MCGIIGYIGKRNALPPILIEGLQRLEYRGYDSAGVALLADHKLIIRKKAGKVADLIGAIGTNGLVGTLGIGHTRWATHGEPNDINAHPHWDCNEEIALIHNGIIENYLTLKKKLEHDGHVMHTVTDTEVLVHLIEEMYKRTKDLFNAVRLALLEVEGATNSCGFKLSPIRSSPRGRGRSSSGWGQRESHRVRCCGALLIPRQSSTSRW
jgi:glucosamine--fructose-6-phosphate aminotransferase (isomerizing)